MIGAIVKQNLVENIIVIDPAQVAELSAALDCEIVDARPYGLAIGDLRTDAGWTRNAGGEQMILPLLEQEQYDSYTVAAKRASELETANEALAAEAATAGENATNEALAILSGEEETA